MTQASPEDKDKRDFSQNTFVSWLLSIVPSLDRFFGKSDPHSVSMNDVNPPSIETGSIVEKSQCVVTDLMESATPEVYASWVAAIAGGSSSVGHQDPGLPFDHKYSEHVSSSVDLWRLHRVQRETGIELSSFLELSDSDQYKLISAIQNQPLESDALCMVSVSTDWPSHLVEPRPSAYRQLCGSTPPSLKELLLIDQSFYGHLPRNSPAIDYFQRTNIYHQYNSKPSTTIAKGGELVVEGVKDGDGKEKVHRAFARIVNAKPGLVFHHVEDPAPEPTYGEWNIWGEDVRPGAVFFPGLTRSQAHDRMMQPIKEGLRIDNVEKGEATILYPKERVRNWMLECGFKLKDQGNGVMDLNPYVYDAAIRMIKLGMSIAKMPEVNVELTD